jgi:hypothetical protein
VHRLVTLTLKHEEKTRDLIELMDYSNYAEMCSEKSLAAKRASTACTRLFHCLLMKEQGARVFDTLIFDLDAAGNMSIFIDEVNMHHKVHLRDDPHIDSVIFFEERLVLAAHVKSIKISGKEDSKKDTGKKPMTNGEKLDAFRQVKSLEELAGIDSIFAPEEVRLFRIFDKVRVRVDTTTEFPLDIKCTLLFGPEEEEDAALLAKQEADKKQLAVRDNHQLASTAQAMGGAASVSGHQPGKGEGGAGRVAESAMVFEAENLDTDV